MLTSDQVTTLRFAAISAIEATEAAHTEEALTTLEFKDRMLEKDLAIARLDDLITALSDDATRLEALQSNQSY